MRGGRGPMRRGGRQRGGMIGRGGALSRGAARGGPPRGNTHMATVLREKIKADLLGFLGRSEYNISACMI